MKPTTYVLALCFALSGCVSLEESPTYMNSSPASAGKTLNTMNNVKLGMSRTEIIAMLGKELLIGYKFPAGSESFEPITIAQPYREESLTKDEKTYQVLYFYTSVNRADDLVADDELTPLIFENGLLVGKGLSDLDRIKRM